MRPTQPVGNENTDFTNCDKCGHICFRYNSKVISDGTTLTRVCVVCIQEENK